LDAYPEAVPSLGQILPRLEISILLTARRPDEGGKNALPLTQRTELILALLPCADLVDLEVVSLPEMPEVLAACRELGVPVVASSHHFSGTPEYSALEDIVAAASAFPEVGAVKVASQATSAADLESLLRLFSLKPRPNLSLMVMGDLGKVSRLLFAKLGSCLNYGFYDESTVPGQWPAARLKALLAEL
jgi:3-dehydroquinate dehydratase-1